MKQQTVYILCGPPASGKSYWAKKRVASEESAVWISRDRVRFSMVSEEEEYFSKEKEVYREFIRQVQEAIDNGVENIYVDATHLNWPSRKKTLYSLRFPPFTHVTAIYFTTSYKECIRRNELREGREQVPDGIIWSMYNRRRSPIHDPYQYTYVNYIKGDK